MPHPQPRTVTRNRTRPRRFSACHRHPTEPVTGFCALCLRDRLAGLDSSSGQIEVEKAVVVSSRRTRGHGGANASAGASVSSSAPELRRSKSVAAGKREVLNDFGNDLRRKSCDVRARSSLSDLFEIDELKNNLGNLGFSKLAEPVLETKEEEEDGESDNGDEIRVLDDEIDDEDDEIEEEGDLKTMKEIIEIELHNKRRNFWEAASVFSKKLRKWRQKQKEKKQSRCINGGTDCNRSKLGQLGKLGQLSYKHGIHAQSEVADYGFGRRSCDTEPRFSIDAHRLSVEDPRSSFDEHRASWDGYMIARTIPRLTPMLPNVNNMMHSTSVVENLQMHSIIEDGVSSGGSAQSISDSSTSNRGSSSSSMKSSSTKTVGLTSDEVKSASNARVSPANDVIFQGTKLVITEKELKDWHLNSIKKNNIESVSNAHSLTTVSTVTTPSNGHKKVTSSRWKKVCNLWSHKDKLDDRKNEEDIQENRSQPCNSSSMNLVRNPNLVNSRSRNMRYSTSDIDSGLLRLYLTPFRNSRRNKSGKSRPPSMAASGMQLN